MSRGDNYWYRPDSICLAFKKSRKVFIREKNAKTKLLPTPKTIKLWNSSKGKVIAMFHVIC